MENVVEVAKAVVAKPIVSRVKCHRKLYKDDKRNIRVIDSPNPLKVKVAIACSDWLESLDKVWYKFGADYHDHESLVQVLKRKFPKYTWKEQSSQRPFDIFSVDAGIALELKTVTGKQKRVITNASVYPTKVKYSDVVTKSVPDYDETNTTKLDVLFVCVNRDANDNLLNYAIVDGAYWGFTYEDYVNCKEIYSNLNNAEFKAKVLNEYLEHFGDNSLVNKLNAGAYGYSIQLNLRTLITLSNPVGRLNVSGWWDI